MNILTSNAHFRQRVIKKSYEIGVTAASKYYRISRNAIYEWRAKYDGKSWKSLVRVVNKWIKPEIKQKQTRKPKPYQRADYPGQKVQVYVKFVPSYCVVNGQKYYQYTAVDECTRWNFRELYDEHSTYSSTDFLKKLILSCPFPIREIQTDNGTEFTRALMSNDGKPSLFEEML